MFEHLGPVPETTKKKKLFSRGYLVFLLIALMIYTVVDSSVSGPDTKAYYEENNAIALVYGANSQNQEFVGDSYGPVFDFFIEAINPNTSLSAIKFKINGDFDPDILSNLRLYRSSVQLGGEARIIDGDYIYFDLGDYKLTQRKNYFYLLLSEGGVADINDKFSFSIEDRQDVFLSYEGQTYNAEGNYPIIGQQNEVVESGRLFFANKSDKSGYYYLSNEPIDLSSFLLSANADRIFLYQISLDYNVDQDVYLGDAIFSLTLNDELLTEAIIDTEEQKITFSLDKFLTLKNNKEQVFGIKVDSLPEGIYDFDMNVNATGYFSGKEVGLKNLNLNKIIVRESYPIITQSKVSEDMADGWNKIYSINLKSAKGDRVSLDKLTWKLDDFNVEIKDIRVLFDGKIQDVGMNMNKDQFSILWESGLILDEKEKTLDLMVNIDNLNDMSNINSYLLSDSVDSNNILWTFNDIQYNSHLLPELPLAPQFLQ